jgi:hypothetical protein
MQVLCLVLHKEGQVRHDIIITRVLFYTKKTQRSHEFEEADGKAKVKLVRMYMILYNVTLLYSLVLQGLGRIECVFL